MALMAIAKIQLARFQILEDSSWKQDSFHRVDVPPDDNDIILVLFFRTKTLYPLDTL